MQIDEDAYITELLPTVISYVRITLPQITLWAIPVMYLDEMTAHTYLPV